MTSTDPHAQLAEMQARAEDPATVSDLVAVCNDARKAYAALTAVLDLHDEAPIHVGPDIAGWACEQCSDERDTGPVYALWPCPTVRAITEKLGGDRGITLVHGLCGDRDDHDPHEHTSESLGKFWCHADQSKRLPYYAEQLQEKIQEGGDTWPR